MAKVTTPVLAEFLAEVTGLPSSTLRTVTRRLREAGYLTQKGHGRGAAEATPMDAAKILLVALIELPSQHSAVVAEQISKCLPGHEFAPRFQGASEHADLFRREEEAFMQGAAIPPDPFCLVAYLITHPDLVRNSEDLQLSINRETSIAVYANVEQKRWAGINYTSLPTAKFVEIFGTPAIHRKHQIAGRAFLEISDFLGIETEGPEAA